MNSNFVKNNKALQRWNKPIEIENVYSGSQQPYPNQFYDFQNINTTSSIDDIKQNNDQQIQIDNAQINGNPLKFIDAKQYAQNYCKMNNNQSTQSSNGTQNVGDSQSNSQNNIQNNNQNNIQNNSQINDFQNKSDNAFKITPMTDLLLANDRGIPMTLNQLNNDPDGRRYLQEIQPGVFTWAKQIEPVNANIGITQTNSIPNRKILNIVSNDSDYQPIFIRDDAFTDDGRADLDSEQLTDDKKFASSRRHKFTTTDPLTNNSNNILRSNYTSFGSEYQPYYDIDSGTTQYAYVKNDSDNSYNQPVYLGNSNVDFIDYVDPMGRKNEILEHQLSLDDVKSTVENQFYNDTTWHRNDMMERLMAKNNRIAWQRKAYPFSGAANTTTM